MDERVKRILDQVLNECDLRKKETLLKKLFKIDPTSIRGHYQKVMIYKAYCALEEDDSTRSWLLSILEGEYQFLIDNTEGHERESYLADRSYFYTEMGLDDRLRDHPPAK